jgi:hypothetical protein
MAEKSAIMAVLNIKCVDLKYIFMENYQLNIPNKTESYVILII